LLQKQTNRCLRLIALDLSRCEDRARLSGTEQANAGSEAECGRWWDVACMRYFERSSPAEYLKGILWKIYCVTASLNDASA
jgi:hypothetical protein